MPTLDDLIVHMRSLGPVAVAYSAGIDSSFLLAAAKRALGSQLLAITLDHPALPRSELAEAEAFCKSEGIPWIPLKANPLDLDEIRSNLKDRCYRCKRHLFELLIETAKSRGFQIVCEGSNRDDDAHYRPGRKALMELAVRSPLSELGFTKAQIRSESEKLHLPQAKKPSAACLMTRFPYGTVITKEALSRVEQGEAILRRYLKGPLRLRDHFPLARIEASFEEIPVLLSNREPIVQALKTLGYTYITIDLEGFRSGSMDEPLTAET